MSLLKYDEALGQRTQAQMAELLKLKTDLEIKRQQLLIAKEEQVYVSPRNLSRSVAPIRASSE